VIIDYLEAIMCRTRSTLMAFTASLGIGLLPPHSARAQAASSSEKIEKLERQTELLQKQLKELKDELARTRKKTDQFESVAAEVPVAAARKVVKAPPPPDKVNLKLGGFLAAETVWRQRNTVADMGSNFGAIPYPFSPLFNEHEFHGSARQSRISLLVEGNLDPTQKLSGYLETDFLGAGTTSNYNQSNSWAPRLRQAYLDYDNSILGFHLLAGQAWSLLTQNEIGITPRRENIPLTIDTYPTGFNLTRNWQVRLVQQFGPGMAAGVSIENPATIFGGSVASAPLGLGGSFTSGTIVDGQEVNFNNAGGSFLTGATIATDTAPDVIEKFAFDPGWGHYEMFAVQRFFTDNVLTCLPVTCLAGSTDISGNAHTKTSFGSGIGGSVLVPLIPKFLEFTGNVMYGRGIGRYGAGTLPDVTVASDRSLAPLSELTAMIGLVGHPWQGLDVYGYAGLEQVNANYFNIGPALFGYGNPGFSNAGCMITTPSSFASTTPTSCIANTHRLSDVTVGFWQTLYKGDYGRVAVGAEYEYIRRQSFRGVGGEPATYDNILMTSLRYYPF
jgi:hypothetical protein